MNVRAMRLSKLVGLAFISAAANTVCASLTAFAVPGTSSATNWTSIDSGWTTGAFNLAPDPPSTYRTVSGEWQEWGSLASGGPHGTSASRILSSEMVQGQTFHFGLDAKSGSIRLADLDVSNRFSEAFNIGAGATDYGYTDANGSVATTIPIGTPIDVQLTWDNVANGDYHGQITVIGAASPAVTWTGLFEPSPTPNSFDLTNHINGFLAVNAGPTSADYFGLKYIEVGSGVLPDPSTLVPEPELVALLPLIVGGILIRKRR